MFSEETREALEERQLTVLKLKEQYAPGTDEFSDLTDEERVLGEILNAQDRVELDHTKLSLDSLDEAARKQDSKKEMFLKIGTEILKVVVPIVSSVLCFRLALGYETQGTFTTKSSNEALKRAITPKI